MVNEIMYMINISRNEMLFVGKCITRLKQFVEIFVIAQ